MIKEYIYSSSNVGSSDNVRAFLRQYAVPEYFASISGAGTSVFAGFLTIGINYGTTVSAGGRSAESDLYLNYGYVCEGGIALANETGIVLTITKDAAGDTVVIFADALDVSAPESDVVTIYTASASSPEADAIPCPYHSISDDLTVLTPFVVPKETPSFTPTANMLTYSQHVSGTGTAILDIDGTGYLSNGLWAVKDAPGSGSSAELNAYALKSDVTSESKRRSEADTALQQTIAAESETRQSADAELQEKYDRTAAVSAVTLGYEKKNFVQTTPVTFSKFGVTATANEDGTITLDGTSSNSNGAYILLTNLRVGGTVTAQEHDNYPLLPPGEYLLTGSSTNDDARIQVRLASEPDSNGESSAISSAAGPVKFTVTEEQKYTYARLYISANASFDNETICPMIRDARIADGAYAPYKPSVEERLSALEARIAELTAAAAAEQEG